MSGKITREELAPELNQEMDDIKHKIDHLDLSAENVTLDSPDFQATNVKDGMEELFTSVNNGKPRLETAIIGKGGTVSKEKDIPTFDELEKGINDITTPINSMRNSQVALSMVGSIASLYEVLNDSSVDYLPITGRKIYKHHRTGVSVYLDILDGSSTYQRIYLFSLNTSSQCGGRFLNNDKLITYKKDSGDFRVYDLNGVLIRTIKASTFFPNKQLSNESQFRVNDFIELRNGKIAALTFEVMGNGTIFFSMMQEDGTYITTESTQGNTSLDYAEQQAFFVMDDYATGYIPKRYLEDIYSHVWTLTARIHDLTGIWFASISDIESSIKYFLARGFASSKMNPHARIAKE